MMTTGRARKPALAILCTLLAALSTLAGLGSVDADEVTLLAGANVKGAIGGRVRGAIQSESASEVLVQLGANTTSVPADQIAAIRYDGQSPNFQLAESRE